MNRLKLISILLLSVGFLPVTARANSVSSLQKSSNQLRLLFDQKQYLSEAQHFQHQNAYSDVALEFRSYNKGPRFEYGLSSKALFKFDEDKERYFAAPEAFVATSWRSKKIRTVIGRKIYNWSSFDESWGLGIWQPNVRWDLLSPEVQGLTGLFHAQSFGRWNLLIFGSPIFFPDQGPYFQVRDGEFYSANRWFRAPVTTMQFRNRDTKINYELEKPSNSEIVSNPGAAMQVAWVQHHRFGPRIRASYAYKPMNQMHLTIQPYHDVSEGVNSLETVATIRPLVIYHHLANMEFGVKSYQTNSYVSITSEWIENTDVPDSWPEASTAQTNYLGAHIERLLSGGVIKPSWFSLAYLYSWRGKEKEKNSIIGDTVQSSLERLPFKNAVKFGFKSFELQPRPGKFGYDFNYIYSITEDGSIFRTLLKYQISKSMGGHLGFDILGTASDQPDDVGLISQYRSNDRVFGGFVYAF